MGDLHYGGLNKSNIELLKFFIEKTRNVKSPLNIREICQEFNSINNCTVTWQGTNMRWRGFRHRIHNFKELDKETIVKLLFGFGVTVDKELMEYLKSDADVELDDRGRITKYEKFGGGLKLEGKHSPSGYRYEKTSDEEMMKFLAETAETQIPIRGNSFVRIFKKSTGYPRNEKYLRHRYEIIRRRIYKAKNYDEETKIKMLFVTGAKIDDAILDKLRKNAIVHVDWRQRIVMYRANNGELNLEGEHGLSVEHIRVGTNSEERQSPPISDSEIVPNVDQLALLIPGFEEHE